MPLQFNSSKFFDFISRRLSKLHRQDVNVLSTILKNQRIEQNMTLEDITKDICSKAYLCKFENNLIDIDEGIAKRLCERVHVDYYKVMNLSSNNRLDHALKLYIYSQKEELEAMYNDIVSDSLYIVNNELIKVLYYLLIHDEKNASNIINSLEKVKTTFSDYELAVFIMCIVEYYIFSSEFLCAKSFCTKLNNDLFCERSLLQIFKEDKFIIHANLGELVEAYIAYNELIKENDNSYPMKRQFRDKVLFLETFYSKDSLKELEVLKNDLVPEEYATEYWYSYCTTLIKLECYEECLDIIIREKLESAEFAALYAYAISESTKQSMKYEIASSKKPINLVKYIDPKYIGGFNTLIAYMNQEKKKSIHRTFVKLVQYELTGTDKQKIIDYLKDVAIAEDEAHQHRLYSAYYANTLLRLLGSIAHYKEAYTLMIKNRNLMCR